MNRNIADMRRLIAETGQLPDGMKLIRDTFNFKVLDKKNVVVEDANGKEQRVMKVTGLFQEGDKPNANLRTYGTREVLRPAVEAIQKDVDRRAVLGEYDHPSDAKIHLDRVSHVITKLWIEGKKVFGEAEILHKLPLGACLRGLFEHKVEVGISSRGVGDMEIQESNGREYYRVMPGYAFVTWDAVAEPSVSGAILNLQESLQKRTKPIHENKARFGKEIYQAMLVREINDFFGLK